MCAIAGLLQLLQLLVLYGTSVGVDPIQQQSTILSLHNTAFGYIGWALLSASVAAILQASCLLSLYSI